MAFDEDFAMMISLISRDGTDRNPGGMVLHGERYQQIREVAIDTDWDDDGYQTGLTAVVSTDERTYEVRGTVTSLIPLRNRRTTPDGELLHTRITEGLTRFRCDAKTGWGLSEYLDQIVDGRPVGMGV
jgi:hypothetical protein